MEMLSEKPNRSFTQLVHQNKTIEKTHPALFEQSVEALCEWRPRSDTHSAAGVCEASQKWSVREHADRIFIAMPHLAFLALAASIVAAPTRT
jgi:hypothetical protein